MKGSRAAYKPEAQVTAVTLINILAIADFDRVTTTGGRSNDTFDHASDVAGVDWAFISHDLQFPHFGQSPP